MLIIRVLGLLGFTLGAAASAAAQAGLPRESLSKAEVAVDYSYVRANATPGNCGCFNLNGGSAEAAIHTYRNFSMVADITGSHTGTTSVPGQSLSLLTFTGGPRFSYPLYRSGRLRITPFLQGLVGGVHGFDAPFPNSSGNVSNSANGLAVLLGGGVDLALNRRLAMRAMQVDYGLNHLPNNASNNENLLRVSVGLIFLVH